MEITLPPDLKQLVEEKIASGEYAGADELVGEALHLLQHRDQLRRYKLAALRREIDLAYEDVDKGDVYDGEEAAAALRQRMARDAPAPE